MSAAFPETPKTAARADRDVTRLRRRQRRLRERAHRPLPTITVQVI